MRKRLLTIVFASILGIAAIVGLRADTSRQPGLTGPFNNLSIRGTFPCHYQGTEYVTIDGFFSGESVFDE